MPTIIALVLIQAYRLTLSPLFGGRCRFTPTCSNYALEAFKSHGFGVALWMSLKRLSQCHPFSGKFGFDPVLTNQKDRC
ncbi:MAG: membrane protein insertion efficiency factor YidD [Oligoflexia bacterium]|nr:membrane protein insertion efficiency factor YidD [Oligoflexia bacterium]